MPTEQEAKPAVVTPSLQQWRSPSTFRGAPGEDPLKWLKEYDRVANFNKWDDMMCVWLTFISFLTVLRDSEEIVQDEVERVLAPVSTKPTETRPRPTYAAVTRKYRAPVQKFPPEPRKTDVWRTADNRPVCFHCGRPGHVMRYCRERKRLSLTTLETADGTSTTLALKKKYADQTLLAVLRQVPREADPQYVVTDPRRHIADPVSRQAVGARKTKESDLQGEASQAVIDCGQNELVLEDICRDSTAPDAWNLYATRDYTLKPHSLTRITVSGYQTRGDINVVLDGSKHLLFEKNIATPSMVSTYRNGKSDVWVTNLQFETKSSLEECA
ncbi:CCHC-type domain-containing protein [Trichonephila clavipes]|nr:CCHC-type domain-containing protein [Trichonephila clavipes]